MDSTKAMTDPTKSSSSHDPRRQHVTVIKWDTEYEGDLYVKMSSPFNHLGSLVPLILILSTGWGTGNRSPPADPLLVPCLLKVAGKDWKDSMDESNRPRRM